MKLSWITDVHLDHSACPGPLALVERVREDAPDGVILTGDVGEAKTVSHYLEVLAGLLRLPLYVVLGNHDFWGGHVLTVRNAVAALKPVCPHLHYLTVAQEPVELAPDVALVGHDGWADARLGRYNPGVTKDQRMVLDLARFTTGAGCLERIAELCDESAAFLAARLAEALPRYRHVIVATHVPPFPEACRHGDALTNDDWLPHMQNRAAGDAILDAASRAPDRRITVLCGHTHNEWTCRPAPNVTAHVGWARHGESVVQGVIEV